MSSTTSSSASPIAIINREIALSLLDAMARNDAQTMRRLLHPEVRQWLPESSTRKMGVGLPVVGAEAVMRNAALGEKRYQSIRFDPQFVVADQDGAAIYAVSTSLTLDGRQLSNRYAVFVRVEDGRVVDLVEHPDTALLFEFFGM
jgi:ketosteroid isomerase-like protein